MTGRRGAPYHAVIVGGGHNGLVCAAYLARAGLRTLVLERRATLGGAAHTAQLAAGVRVPALAHTVGRFSPRVAHDLELSRHRLSLVQPSVRAFAPQTDGPPVTLWSDTQRTSAELRARSPRDAAAYPAFDRLVRALGGALAQLASVTPPDTRRPGLDDALDGIRVVMRVRALGADDTRQLLRVLPMPVDDFVAEWLETDALRAVIAARGVAYTALGPRSAGSTQVLLADSAGNDGGAAGQSVIARGGPGALTDALAASARSLGVDIRTEAEVATVTVRDGRATGVVLTSGDEVEAAVVVSGLDPKRTLLGLVDPAVLGPTMVWRTRNLRLGGVVAKVNLALSALPRFHGIESPEDERRLRGRIVMAGGARDLEAAQDAAKYGRVADEPFLEATIPTLVDASLVDTGLARGVAHVMSVVAQPVPYHRRVGTWDDDREELGDTVLRRLEAFAPGISGLVVHRQVLTPVDLERDYGLTEGHPYHGEPTLDQWFAWRPLLGQARYRLAVQGLYLCGAGAHPGGGVTGLPGRNAAREIIRDARRRRAD